MPSCEYYDDLMENIININDDNKYDSKKDNKKDTKENGIHKIKFRYNNYFKGKFYKNINIQFYESGNTGSRIRNAITGEYYPYKVGSIYEDLFFKVSLENDKTPINIFYESPEEYEINHFIILKDEVKDKWKEKYFLIKNKIQNI